MSEEQLVRFLSPFKNSVFIESIVIVSCTLSPHACVILSEMLQTCPKLKKLRFISNYLNDKKCENLFKEPFLNLEHLEICDNEMGDSSCKLISKTLQHPNNSLKNLCIYANIFESSGCKYLAKGLANNITLEFLDVSHNSVEGEGAIEFSE
jgi:Ran GTPase-activating protein (RanGAP) involved in mRNA processing and transport